MKSDLIDIAMQIHAKTEKAVLASDDGDEAKTVWLPLSQIEMERRSGAFYIITMPDWLAIDKGLI